MGRKLSEDEALFIYQQWQDKEKRHIWQLSEEEIISLIKFVYEKRWLGSIKYMEVNDEQVVV